MPGVSNKLLFRVAENPCISFVQIDEPVFFIGYSDAIDTAGKGFKEPSFSLSARLRSVISLAIR